MWHTVYSGWQVLKVCMDYWEWLFESSYSLHLHHQAVHKEASWTAWPWRWRYYDPSKCRKLCTNDTVQHELSEALLWKPQIWYYEDWWLAKESYHTYKKMPVHKDESCFMKHQNDLKLNLHLHGNKQVPMLPNKCTVPDSSINHYPTALQVWVSGSTW